MKITRVLEGERYTALADGGTGYRSEIAVEDGFEIEHLGSCFWVSDVRLEHAIDERNRSMTEEALYDEGATVTLEVPEVPVLTPSGRCGHCNRPGTIGPCSFDCATCYRCKKPIADGTIRVLTTMDRVYCLACA